MLSISDYNCGRLSQTNLSASLSAWATGGANDQLYLSTAATSTSTSTRTRTTTTTTTTAAASSTSAMPLSTTASATTSALSARRALVAAASGARGRTSSSATCSQLFELCFTYGESCALRWYYNSQTAACAPFAGGNCTLAGVDDSTGVNRFTSSAACQDSCLSTMRCKSEVEKRLLTN